MITRLSNFLFKTLREAPADAELESHRLLLRAGYVRRTGSGLYVWLPLGLRVKQRIENIIREEMRSAGAIEVFFPGLLPADSYKTSGRWEEYGDNLFRIKDRKGADYLLAPTHEEVFTLLVQGMCESYKDLPLVLYQIQDKFRDEPRARGGLLRIRQFTMKDAYSFHMTETSLEKSYQDQRAAYKRIFDRLGLEYVIVSAEAGAMGGSKSEEFMYPSPIGEDTLIVCPSGLAANVEAYRTLPTPDQPLSDKPEIETIKTPGAKTIDVLRDHFGGDFPYPPLKTLLLKHTEIGQEPRIVALLLPADRKLDTKRAEVSVGDLEYATIEDIDGYPGLIPGFLGPTRDGKPFLGKAGQLGIPLYVDPRVAQGSVWLSGGNYPDIHLAGIMAGRDFVADEVWDVAEIKEGDPAPDGSGPVQLRRGVELGHIFQLGRKYSQALGFELLDESGSLKFPTMGCYGIGVGRLVAIAAEQYRDDQGLVWPQNLAPYDLHVILLTQEAEGLELAEEFMRLASDLGYEILVDDRRESAGVKFIDAELVGVPKIIIFGRGAASGEVEVWRRVSKARHVCSIEKCLRALKEERSGRSCGQGGIS